MKIQFINRTRRKVPAKKIKSDVKKVLSWFSGRQPGAKKILSLALVFVSDAESRRLNRKFLKKNRPANVLSFRYDSEAELILAPDVIRRQARAEGRAYFHELRRMAVHGMLHLAGIHHEGSEKQIQRFERLESELLRSLKIPNPKSQINPHGQN